MLRAFVPVRYPSLSLPSSSPSLDPLPLPRWRHHGGLVPYDPGDPRCSPGRALPGRGVPLDDGIAGLHPVKGRDASCWCACGNLPVCMLVLLLAFFNPRAIGCSGHISSLAYSARHGDLHRLGPLCFGVYCRRASATVALTRTQTSCGSIQVSSSERLNHSRP